jgi:gamma-glutamylcyclotransferase
MPGIHYLAYGSNLHPLRLAERAPSARHLGVVVLSGRRVVFQKRGRDGSGKCSLVADIAGEGPAFGVLYEIDGREKRRLDAVEGPGYEVSPLEVTLGGTTYPAYTYVASPSGIDPSLRPPTQAATSSARDVASPSGIDPSLRPYDWYQRLVLAGARHHALPPAYVSQLGAVAAIPDPDPRRRARNEGLLARMGERLPDGPARPLTAGSVV